MVKKINYEIYNTCIMEGEKLRQMKYLMCMITLNGFYNRKL